MTLQVQPAHRRACASPGAGLATTTWLGFLVLALSLMLLSLPAHANCKLTNGTVMTTVTFTPPSAITVSAADPVGTVLWSSAPTAPASSPWLNCQPNGDVTGIVSTVGPQPANTSSPVFPTSIPGLGFQIVRNDNGTVVPVYPNGSVPKGKFQLSTTVTLKLIVTGTVGSGSLSGTIGSWSFLGVGPVENLNLGSPVTVTSNACSVSAGSQNLAVNLPSVSTSAFSGVGSTSGDTPFSIQLNCPGGPGSNTVLLQLDANNPYSSSVLSNSGTATSVGVQLLDGNGTPIQFGTPQNVGVTTSTQIVAKYQARYYQTSSNAAGLPGSVSATATFTISYQ